MTHLTRLILAGSILVACPTLADAQVNPFRGRGNSGLRGQDFRDADAAAKKLLARPDLGVGSTEAWENGKTGVTGTVSVEDSNTSRGMSCHRVNYATEQRGGRQRNVVVNWCQTPSGWKIG